MHLKDESPFGRVLAHVSVAEFLKRGLVHAHIILFLDQEAKFSLQYSLQVDKFISAEISPHSMPQLRGTDLKHMIHKPCNVHASALCLKEGKCSKRFPKPFRPETCSIHSDYYMTYKKRSREDSDEVEQVSAGKGPSSSKFRLDDSWAVQYSPDLLRKFRTHMNVELCISKLGSIKYLFKYFRKGSDRVAVE